MQKSLKIAAVLVAVTAASASAQTGRNSNGVPPGQRPPDGMCRVWVTGVAPGRQSAPTDCATAEAQARLTANARVIYGGFPGKKHSSDGLLTRRRELPDGSWVLDRYRRDANGNIVIVSTRALRDSNKAHRKAVKHELKDERKAEKRQDKIEGRAEKRQDKMEDHGHGNGGGKGKGKH